MSDNKRSLIAVILSMVVVNLVYGLTLPLLSLVLDSQGVSKTVIGMSIVAQASGGVALALLGAFVRIAAVGDLH